MVRRLCSIIGACCMSDRTIEVGFYRPQQSWGKVIFSEACVKNSVGGGGGIPACLAGFQRGG